MKAFSFLLLSVIHHSAAVVFYPDSVSVSVDGIVKQLKTDNLYQPVCTQCQSNIIYHKKHIEMLMSRLADNDDDFRQVSEVSMLTKYAFEPTVCTFYEELGGGNEGTVSTIDPERNLTNAPVSIGKYLCTPGLSYIPMRQERGSIRAS